MVPGMPPGKRSLVFGWWYISIGVGFLLLGLNRILLHDRFWAVLIRWLIAVGFLALGCMELRRRKS